MPRTKGSISKKVKTAIDKKKCYECSKEKPISHFYKSNNQNHEFGVMNVCKECASPSDINDLEEVKRKLYGLDRPFLPDVWERSISESQNRGWSDVFGIYIKNINLPQHRSLTWKDSQEENNDNIKNTSEEIKYDGISLEQLKEKYGYGYPDDEYILFEKKYQQLRSSFQLLTTMHEEYFREYCINKVKETLAKAKGNFKEAKEWAAMVKDVAEAGKLKPSQMSKADLSGGLDGFGQLARMVEENFEIQPLLPRFTEQPKDKVDVVLWYLVNYVRDLKGLPSCEYREIYDFYNKRKLEYENQMTDSNFAYYDGNDDVDE